MSFDIDVYNNEENSNNLFNAVMNEDITQITSIFNKTNIKPWDFKNKERYNALQTACFSSFFSVVKVMIDRMKVRVSQEVITAWINEKSEQGYTSLHYASYKGNIEIIKILIENGAIVAETNNKGLNVMHMAAQGDQANSLIYFKEKYNLSYDKIDSLGSTPLHWACYTGSEGAFMFLLYFEGIDLNPIDNEGLTPLHLSVMGDRTSIIKKLLRSGARKDIKDRKERMPHELAKSKNKKKIEEILKDERTNCNMCALKIPLHKLERSNFNIYFFFISHFVLESLIFFIVIPCKLLNI